MSMEGYPCEATTEVEQEAKHPVVKLCGKAGKLRYPGRYRPFGVILCDEHNGEIGQRYAGQ